MLMEEQSPAVGKSQRAPLLPEFQFPQCSARVERRFRRPGRWRAKPLPGLATSPAIWAATVCYGVPEIAWRVPVRMWSLAFARAATRDTHDSVIELILDLYFFEQSFEWSTQLL